MTNEFITATNFVSRDITGLEVVGKVNELYSSVFNLMLLMLGIVATIVVVILPVFFSIFQRRERRLQEAKLAAENRSQIDEIKRNLKKEIDDEVQSDIKKLKELMGVAEKRLKNETALARAGVFHIQAMFYNTQGTPHFGLESAIDSGDNYIEIEDHGNLQRILRVISTSLDKCNKSHFEKIEDLSARLDTFFERIKKCDNKNVLLDQLQQVKREKKNAVQKNQ